MSMDARKKSIITILSSTMVQPSDETPRGSLWLSRLDMMARQPYSHSRILFVYQPDETHNIQPPFQTPYFDTDILKKSLGKVLVPFYSIAGRLQINKTNGRYEIDCNAEGALFVEAETTICALTDLGCETNPNSKLTQELFATCDYSLGLSSIPLLMVQLTRFKCGGVCLGCSIHHHAADGSTFFLLKNSWARLTQGLEINIMPVHERFKYLAPRDPPKLDFLDPNYIEPSLPPSDLYGTKASTTNNIFILSKRQINALKQEAMSFPELLSSHKITTFTILAGHVWRSVCKARNLSPDQDVKLYVPIDGRQVLKDPTLPLGYTGNAIVCAVCKAKAGDLVDKPLWYAVSKVCEGITKMKDPNCYRSTIDYIETQPSLEPLIRGAYNFTCPNLWINTWAKMPYNKADFGWGAPRYIRHGGGQSEGHSGFLPSVNDDGTLLLSLTLFTVHMTSFEKYLYEFQVPIPSQFKGVSSLCKL